MEKCIRMDFSDFYWKIRIVSSVDCSEFSWCFKMFSFLLMKIVKILKRLERLFLNRLVDYHHNSVLGLQSLFERNHVGMCYQH